VPHSQSSRGPGLGRIYALQPGDIVYLDVGYACRGGHLAPLSQHSTRGYGIGDISSDEHAISERAYRNQQGDLGPASVMLFFGQRKRIHQVLADLTYRILPGLVSQLLLSLSGISHSTFFLGPTAKSRPGFGRKQICTCFRDRATTRLRAHKRIKKHHGVCQFSFRCRPRRTCSRCNTASFFMRWAIFQR